MYSELRNINRLKNNSLFQSVYRYYSKNHITCIPDSTTILIWTVTSFFTSSPTINYLNRFSRIRDSATIFIWRMNTFSHLCSLIFITIISLVFLIEKQYVFEQWQAFSLRIQLYNLSIVSLVRFIHIVSLKSVKIFHFVSNYIFSQSFHLYSWFSHNVDLKNEYVFPSLLTDIYNNHLTCILVWETIYTWTVTSFFIRLQLYILSIVSLVFLIQPHYLFEEWQAFSLPLQLLIILIDSVVFLIQPQNVFGEWKRYSHLCLVLFIKIPSFLFLIPPQY